MIIGICGLIGSGKGTVADILVDQGFKVEIDKLDEELRNYVDGSDPLSFIIG